MIEFFYYSQHSISKEKTFVKRVRFKIAKGSAIVIGKKCLYTTAATSEAQSLAM